MFMETRLLAAVATCVALGVARDVQLIDPINRYSGMQLALPPANFPVLQTSFDVRPDCGEGSYNGTGRLRGLKALITGGDSGMGRSVVIAFLREGAHVAINYLPDEEPDAEDLANFLQQEGLSFKRIPGDLRNESFCEHLVHEAAHRLGGLDILVSNAAYPGIIQGPEPEYITNQSTAHLHQIYETNVFAQFYLTRAAVPLLPRGGSIIFTTSGIVAAPDPIAVAYGSSKAAIAHIIRSLSRQLIPRGIRVNGIAPGIMYTPFLPTGGFTTDNMTAAAQGSPYGRMEQPAEMAPLFVSLADPQGTYTNGEIFSGTGAVPGL